jgi:hypothetical protein
MRGALPAKVSPVYWRFMRKFGIGRRLNGTLKGKYNWRASNEADVLSMAFFGLNMVTEPLSS